MYKSRVSCSAFRFSLVGGDLPPYGTFLFIIHSIVVYVIVRTGKSVHGHGDEVFSVGVVSVGTERGIVANVLQSTHVVVAR